MKAQYRWTVLSYARIVNNRAHQYSKRSARETENNETLEWLG